MREPTCQRTPRRRPPCRPRSISFLSVGTTSSPSLASSRKPGANSCTGSREHPLPVPAESALQYGTVILHQLGKRSAQAIAQPESGVGGQPVRACGAGTGLWSGGSGGYLLGGGWRSTRRSGTGCMTSRPAEAVRAWSSPRFRNGMQAAQRPSIPLAGSRALSVRAGSAESQLSARRPLSPVAGHIGAGCGAIHALTCGYVGLAGLAAQAPAGSRAGSSWAARDPGMSSAHEQDHESEPEPTLRLAPPSVDLRPPCHRVPFSHLPLRGLSVADGPGTVLRSAGATSRWTGEGAGWAWRVR
ncbi:hypothetical protein EES37_34820 [Streptomyces sp. ADI91-18]|nr:hypothetical protein EES37_34820 [Streptomyces sp. ADI91-18]